MFLTEPDKTELRQGDIVFGLVYPIVNSTALDVLCRPDARPRVDEPATFTPVLIETRPYGNSFLIQLRAVMGYSVILSQCCDLSLRDGKLVNPGFVLSPLTQIPYTIRTNPDNLTRLQSNTLTDYTSLYYLRAQVPLTLDLMVDFSTVASVVNKDYALALEGKVLQMTDEERARFKTKLAAHFGRPTEEEIQAGLFPTA
jgi:hypothetical protein